MSAQADRSAVTFELGVDSLCWNRPIAQGILTLEGVLDAGTAVRARWLRLHQNHLGAGDVFTSLNRIRELTRAHGQSVIWSGDAIGQSSTHTVADAVGHIERELEKAVAVEADYIQFYAGWFRSERHIAVAGTAPEVEFTSSVLTAVVPSLNDGGMTLGLENHSNFTSHEMVEIMQNVGSSSARIYLDVANPWPVGEDVPDAVRRMAPYAIAVDVKDIYVESRWSMNKWHRKGYDVIYTWPGEGILPWQMIWKALAEGLEVARIPIVIEGLTEDDDPARGIRSCVDFMQALDGPGLSLLSETM